MRPMAHKSLYDYDKQEPGTTTTKGGAWREGFCTICATDKAPHTCVKCDSNVCSEHFVSIMGLCVECAPVKDRGKTFKIAEPLKKEIPKKEIPSSFNEISGPSQQEKTSNPAKKTYEIVVEPVKKRKMKKVAFIPRDDDGDEDPCPCAKSDEDKGKNTSKTAEGEEEAEDEPTIDWV